MTAAASWRLNSAPCLATESPQIRDRICPAPYPGRMGDDARTRQANWYGFFRGYEAGYREGLAARRTQREAGPPRIEIERVAGQLRYSDDACGRAACRGCSACTRASAVTRNRASFGGSSDFPGTDGLRETK
jgi:hypothetical protein